MDALLDVRRRYLVGVSEVPATTDPESTVPPGPVPILHRDNEFVVVSKPSGLLVHRSSISPDRDALLQRVRDQIGQYVYPIHRIDRPTSGIVLFALSKPSAAAAAAALTSDSTRKEYLLLARGETPDEFQSDRPLTADDGTPQPALSEFITLERFGRVSLVRARIRTGRTHQIRRHLNHLGAHVVGDTRYGKGWLNREFRERFSLHRLFLHSHRLSLEVAEFGARIDVTDPLPDDLALVLARLRSEGLSGSEPEAGDEECSADEAY